MTLRGDCLVAGSGPAGVACASALLDAGRHVTMVDVGVELGDPLSDAVQTIANLPAGPAREEGRRLAARKWTLEGKEFPLKRVFGSSFPYALDSMKALIQEGTRCVQSEARGGLSTVWGAAVLPWRERDFAGFPFSIEALAPHYEAVARWMPIAGPHDQLDETFQFSGELQSPLAPSLQAGAILEHLAANDAALRRAGVTWGQSRLAVRTSGASACRHLGLCLSGCPQGAIWSAAERLKELLPKSRFRYLPGFRVEQVFDRDRVAFHGRNTETGESMEIEGERGFLALGVIATLQVVTRSFRMEGPLSLAYHPYFLVPVWLARGIPSVSEDFSHSLAQVFLEIDNPALSPNGVHLQVYTFTPLFEDQLAMALACLGPKNSPIRRAFLGHLGAVQGYLHSSDAAPIKVTIEGDRLRLEAPSRNVTSARMRAVAAVLRRQAKNVGFTPLPFGLRAGLPGEGNHIGATFPMSSTPMGHQSDILGRVRGARRIHVVDASVLSALPAPTITFSAMANAHRIGTEAAQLESSPL